MKAPLNLLEQATLAYCEFSQDQLPQLSKAYATNIPVWVKQKNISSY